MKKLAKKPFILIKKVLCIFTCFPFAFSIILLEWYLNNVYEDTSSRYEDCRGTWKKLLRNSEYSNSDNFKKLYSQGNSSVADWNRLHIYQSSNNWILISKNKNILILLTAPTLLQFDNSSANVRPWAKQNIAFNALGNRGALQHISSHYSNCHSNSRAIMIWNNQYSTILLVTFLLACL